MKERMATPYPDLPVRARFLESFPFFMVVFVTGVVVPVGGIVGGVLFEYLSLPVAFETVFGTGALILLLGAAMLFDQDEAMGFFRQSVFLGYVVKYISIPHALSALLSTIIFGMLMQDGPTVFEVDPRDFRIGIGLFVALLVLNWVIAVASFLAGDARIRMIRRERKLGY
jgi:hypothetical protein